VEGGEVRKLAVAVAVVGALALAAGAGAAGRWVVSNINQIKPSVRHQLRGNTGPPGSQGPQGPQGAPGPAGGSGVGQTQLIGSPKVTLQPGQNTYGVDPSGFQANCPSGYTATGTGFDGEGVASIEYLESYGFFVGGFLVNNSSVAATVQIFAVCAPGSSGPAPARDVSGLKRHLSGLEGRYHSDLREAATRVSMRSAQP
jgi:hypothetical protein